jgi:hypothetical protein
MVQEISVHEFTWNKATNTLSTFVSDLAATHFNFEAALRYEAFMINGETRNIRYCFYEVEREKTRFEHGDIVAWKFRPVDGFGRGIEGPRLVVYND